eukprot:1014542-Alexandrium_andersonii.AAC.1
MPWARYARTQSGYWSNAPLPRDSYVWEEDPPWTCRACGTHHRNGRCAKCRECGMPKNPKIPSAMTYKRPKAPWDR